MRRALILILCVAFLPRLSAGRDGDSPGVTPEQRRAAARRAIAWLDENLLTLPDVRGTPRKPFTYATAGLVYLMSPDSRTGPTPLAKIVDYLDGWIGTAAKRAIDPDEMPSGPGGVSSEFFCQYTWPLAQSAILFSELHERGVMKTRARRSLARIVDLLSAAQQENGGWGHHRFSNAAREPDSRIPEEIREKMREIGSGYPTTLLAASNTVATGLGVTQLAIGRGSVPGLPEARRYYRKARLDNGNFPYDPSQRSSGHSLNGVSRTGGALLAMYWLGIPTDDPDVRGSLKFILDKFDYLAEAHGSPALNLMQSAWALKLLDEKAWRRFEKEYYPRLLEHQAEDGSLGCICEGKAFGTTCDSETLGGGLFARGQSAYVTALHAFILLLAEDRLEIAGRRPRPVPRTERTE